MPWKNGGGVTRDVAVFPQGAGMSDFLWRVSMADVVEAGPFSTFEGIDRNISILSGQLDLRIQGQTISLTPARVGFRFHGEDPVMGEPIGGPVLDLNVMTWREAYWAEVQALGSAVATTDPNAEVTLLLALNGCTLLDHELQRHDALLIDGDDLRHSAIGFLPIIVIAIRRK